MVCICGVVCVFICGVVDVCVVCGVVVCGVCVCVWCVVCRVCVCDLQTSKKKRRLRPQWGMAPQKSNLKKKSYNS